MTSGTEEDRSVAVNHQEFYTATDGSQWMMQIHVHWLPYYNSEVRLLKMPDRVPINLPTNLPYLDVVPQTLRDAALDGCFDLRAITRYCVQQCLRTLREYVERFGKDL